MSRSAFKHAVFCTAFIATTTLALHAQDAAPAGDRQGQRMGSAGARRGGGVRGTVTSVNGANLVMRNEAGETWTVITTDNTRVRVDGQPGTLATVKPGDEAMAMGVPDADKHEVHALFVVDVSAAAVAKAKANLGKTYIVGRITAINDTQLTVQRSDKVAQTITLDESTSLHRGGRMDPAAMQAAGLDMGVGGMGMGGGMMGGGMMGGGGGRNRNADAGDRAPGPDTGESITLADVKVGDTVVGLGSIKGGVFVPTDLRVQAPRGPGMGGGRRNGNGTTPPPPPQP